MDWYKSLTIFQKINFKNSYHLFMGVGFSDLDFMFSFKERIQGSRSLGSCRTETSSPKKSWATRTASCSLKRGAC